MVAVFDDAPEDLWTFAVTLSPAIAVTALGSVPHICAEGTPLALVAACAGGPLLMAGSQLLLWRETAWAPVASGLGGVATAVAPANNSARRGCVALTDGRIVAIDLCG